MPHYRISEAATLLGVSDDTLRRWVTQGRLGAQQDRSGRLSVDGADLAHLAQDLARGPVEESLGGVPRLGHSSARNRARGLVTKVVVDGVMAQVDLQCGPYRFVSLMSAEAVRDLRLEVGDTAAAVVKATNVIVETAKEHK